MDLHHNETDNFHYNDDEEMEVRLLNRSVIIFQMNDAFYNWYRDVVTTPEEKEKILLTPHTFLIPPFNTDEEVEEYLSDNFFTIFEALLEEFIDDGKTLEQALTEENFDSWVEFNFSTFAMDAAADYELSYEDEETSTEVESEHTL